MEKDINKTEGTDEPDLSNKIITTIDLLKRLQNQQKTIKNNRNTILEYLDKLEESLNSNSMLKEELNLNVFVLLIIETTDTIKHRSLSEHLINMRLEYEQLRIELSKKLPHNDTKEFLIEKIKNRIQNIRCMFTTAIVERDLLKEKILLRSFGITYKKKKNCFVNLKEA